MTLEEILNNLERLKELTNDSGKGTIEGLKAGIRELVEKKPESPPRPEAKPSWWRSEEEEAERKKAAAKPPEEPAVEPPAVPKAAVSEPKPKPAFKRRAKK